MESRALAHEREAYFMRGRHWSGTGMLLGSACVSGQIEFAVRDEATEQRKGKIFIGHGCSSVWRELKDYLNDELRLEWDEFERVSTSGLTVADRLRDMLDQANMAVLIMTAEDEYSDGTAHARENVIHELGLFQGRLGWTRVILLVEEGCSEFSNIAGVCQIRFPKDHVRAAFHEIRRTIEREGWSLVQKRPRRR